MTLNNLKNTKYNENLTTELLYITHPNYALDLAKWLPIHTTSRVTNDASL
ncbi:hypothetical protein HMI01_21540 [Halolactibacillus miurensis]|uniref:Uncharacterized protein n=1 Tax=Halolactibacillus miurensis TaxID=306541 RepID=A0ABQ0VVL0_9BACI|nr:hypothetical protein HMI01_21540 [Halolactibacillus miurensis]